MRPLKPLAIALWTLALASVAVYAFMHSRPAPAPGIEIIVEDNAGPAGDGRLPVLFPAPEFELTDQQGRPFSSEDLKGKVWIGFIFLTHCPTGACPIMAGKIAALQDALPDERVHFVSFSIDPERDTPEVLAKYAQEVGGTDVSQRWHLLTGESADQMKQLALSLKLAVGEDWGHSTVFLLVDAHGNVRGSFGNEDPEGMARLAAAVGKVLAED